MENESRKKEQPKKARSLNPSPEIQTAVIKLWNAVRRTAESAAAHREAHAELAARIALLEEDLSSQSRQFSDALSLAEESSTSLETQEGELSGLRKRLVEFEEKAERQEREIAELTAAAQETAVSSDRTEELIRERDEALAQLETASRERTDLENSVADLREKSVAAETRIVELSSELERLRQQEESAEYLKAELVRRNEQLYEQGKETLNYKESIAELQNRIRTLEESEQALQGAEEKLRALEQERADTSAEVDADLQPDEAAAELRGELERKTIEAQREITDLSAALDAHKERIERLTEEKSALTAQKQELERRLEEADSTIPANDADTAQLAADNMRVLENDLQSKDARIEELTEQLRTYRELAVPGQTQIFMLSDEERAVLRERLITVLHKVERAIGAE